MILNKKAAELAKRVANDFSTKDKPRWVAGSMGPTTKLPTLGPHFVPRHEGVVSRAGERSPRTVVLIY
jgi:methionine synthase I (cobalamin-dependent)